MAKDEPIEAKRILFYAMKCLICMFSHWAYSLSFVESTQTLTLTLGLGVTTIGALIELKYKGKDYLKKNLIDK